MVSSRVDAAVSTGSPPTKTDKTTNNAGGETQPAATEKATAEAVLIVSPSDSSSSEETVDQKGNIKDGGTTTESIIINSTDKKKNKSETSIGNRTNKKEEEDNEISTIETLKDDVPSTAVKDVNGGNNSPKNNGADEDDGDDDTVSTFAAVDMKRSSDGSTAPLANESVRGWHESNGSSARKKTTEEAVRIIRVEGVAATCVVVPGTQSTVDDGRKRTASETVTAAGEQPDEGDDDEWETVEVKSRNNRNRRNHDNRNGNRFGQGRGGGSSSSGGAYGNNNSNAMNNNSNQFNVSGAGANHRKVKTGRHAARKRHANRKMVRDILNTVLDTVDTEVKRRRRTEKSRRPKPGPSTASQGPPVSAWSNALPSSRPSTQLTKTGKPATLRDILLGGLNQSAPAATGAPAPAKVSGSPHMTNQSTTARTKQVQRNPGPAKAAAVITGATPTQNRNDSKKPPIAPPKKSTSQPSVADQNTASTVPETMSGTSNTHSSLTNEEIAIDQRVSQVPSDETLLASTAVSNADAEVEPEPAVVKPEVVDAKDSSLAPPLQTLLGPGNTNSATSSVASSLEAPHTSSRRHHHSSSAPENDVGYHLLDVCDRLTNDIGVFMERRERALAGRRRERGALLAALQETTTVRFIADCLCRKWIELN